MNTMLIKIIFFGFFVLILGEASANELLHLRILEYKDNSQAKQDFIRLKENKSLENTKVDDIGEICFDDLKKELRNAIAELKEGEYSSIIAIDSKYLIVQLVKKMGECKAKTYSSEYQRNRVGNVCSICGKPAVFWCNVRKAWFCDEHAGKTYTPSGGYRYRCY